jgi:hypothetical protein
MKLKRTSLETKRGGEKERMWRKKMQKGEGEEIKENRRSWKMD